MQKEVKTSRQNTLTFTIIVVAVIIVIISTILLQQQIPFVSNNTGSLDKYQPEAIYEICSILDIQPTNEFCSNSQDQDADTFLLFIEESFPYGTIYSELTSKIEGWSPVAGGCNGEIIYGSCPSPDTCTDSNTYLCSYDLSFTEASTQLNVRIRRNDGTIIEYSVLEAGDS